MLEKIEITQRFNFKKLNKHYECFIIDLINKTAYFKINERIYNEQIFEKSYSCDNSWIPVLSDLKNRVSSKIYSIDDKSIKKFLVEFDKLNLFDEFTSEDFSYFEKLQSIYSCNINLYFTDDYQEFCIKSDFPEKWIVFNELLVNLVNFDVLNLNNLEKVVTNLFYRITSEGIYDNLDTKLELTSLEFGHYECLPFDVPHPSVIIDVESCEIDGYYENDSFDVQLLLDLLEKYGVYKWIFKEYQNKSENHDSQVLDGYDWYLELVFNNSIIWNILGHNEYPDTYLCLAYEIKKITNLDLLEIESIPNEEIELFNYYGKMKLS